MPYEREDTKEMENICGPFTRKEMYLYIVWWCYKYWCRYCACSRCVVTVCGGDCTLSFSFLLPTPPVSNPLLPRLEWPASPVTWSLLKGQGWSKVRRGIYINRRWTNPFRVRHSPAQATAHVPAIDFKLQQGILQEGVLAIDITHKIKRVQDDTQ
jgi:hypothetical protein